MTDDEKLIAERFRLAVCHLPPAEEMQAMDWIEATLETGTNQTALCVVELLLNGQARIDRMVNGEPLVAATEALIRQTVDEMATSPEGRAEFDRLMQQYLSPQNRTAG